MRARGALLGCLNRLAGAAAAGRPSRGAAATRTLSSVTRPTESGVFELPELKLAAGGVLRPARLAWASYGEPGAPVILHPTSFDARTPDLEYAIGHGERFILDTRRHRVVVVARLRVGVEV